MVDSILSLTITIAEGKNTYAMFLGSGVSKAAGIPTGSEILWNNIKLLYKLINEKEPKDNEFKEWFEKSEFKDFSYSKILKTICSSQEERRKFLEKYFVGRNPTDTHKIIADMVKKKLIKIIITTNFDRLMEKALDNVGIIYDVASSSAELKSLKPREHSPCRILKLHGDYQSSEIKNTEQELTKLEPGIESEFKEMLDRYGIIVMGYRGLDEGVMQCFEKRNSKYTLYWLKTGDMNERVNKLLNQQDGKIIERENSDIFLKELASKIEIFSHHETGDTPDFLMQLTKQFIKENDEVSFWEEVKKQSKIIRKRWQDIYEDIKDDSKKDSKGLKALETYSDRILCIGLILIEYNKKDYFQKILSIFQEIYDLADMFRSGFQRILNIPFVMLHDIFYSWGSLALRKERFDIIKDLLDYKIMDRKNGRYNNILINSLIFFPITLETNTMKAFDSLRDSFDYKEFLKEYFYSVDDFSVALCEFNCLLNLYVRVKNLKNIWGRYVILPIFKRFYSHPSERFTVRLRSDSGFLKMISKEICGEEIEIFIKNYPLRCDDINNIDIGVGTESKLDRNLFLENSS